MSKNQLRKLRRRERNTARAGAKNLDRLSYEVARLNGTIANLQLELDRERGLKPFPPKNTIDGLSYWIGRSVYGT